MEASTTARLRPSSATSRVTRSTGTPRRRDQRRRPLCRGRGEQGEGRARRLVGQNGAYVNNVRVEDVAVLAEHRDSERAATAQARRSTSSCVSARSARRPPLGWSSGASPQQDLSAPPRTGATVQPTGVAAERPARATRPRGRRTAAPARRGPSRDVRGGGLSLPRPRARAPSRQEVPDLVCVDAMPAVDDALWEEEVDRAARGPRACRTRRAIRLTVESTFRVRLERVLRDQRGDLCAQREGGHFLHHNSALRGGGSPRVEWHERGLGSCLGAEPGAGTSL